jgi:tetratricopeptide (TPR) repeat protein
MSTHPKDLSTELQEEPGLADVGGNADLCKSECESKKQAKKTWKAFLPATVIILAALAAYSNSFTGVFVFDDEGAILKNPTIKHLWPVWKMFDPPANGAAVQRRPVVNASLALNYAISGRNPWSYHLFNLTAHILVALLLFTILRRSMLMPLWHGQWKDAATPLALCIATVWAVHPLLTDAVTYVIQRTEVLAGLFYLLTLYCVIRSVDSVRSLQWQIAAVAACALAMGSKEAAISAPVVVLIYDRIFLSGSWREIFHRRLWLYIGLAATWTIILLVISQGKEGSAVFGEMAYRVVQYAMAQCGVICHYLRLCFWPAPLMIDYGYYTTQSAADIVPYLLIITGLLAATVLALHYQSWLGFLGVWFFAILAPSSSIIPLHQQIAAEKRMYLPSAAVVTLVVLGCFFAGRWCVRRNLFSVKTAKTIGYAMTLAVVVTLGVVTFERNTVYASVESIWIDALKKNPDNFRAKTDYSKVLIDLGRYDEAIKLCQEILDSWPTFLDAHCTYGSALFALGRYSEAAEQYEKVLAVKGDIPEYHYDYGNALYQLRRFEEAALQYELSLKLSPYSAETHNNLGMALSKRGQDEEALRHYQAAIELDPDFALPYRNYGNVLVGRGKTEEAIQLYQKAIAVDPADAENHNNLGSAFVRKGLIDEAIAEYKKTIELNPKFETAYGNLGAILAQQGQLDQAIEYFQKALELNPKNTMIQEFLKRASAQREQMRNNTGTGK